jgi:peptide/nickel transport system substrate-binding protein
MADMLRNALLSRVAASFAVAVLATGCRDSRPPQAGSRPPGGRSGGQVVVGIVQDISTFNEYQWSGDSYELQIIGLLFPSLMTEQPDYSLHPPSFAPSLASAWEFSQDNSVVTFHLRQDARWSDGTPVTAEDVRFTYLIQKDPRISSPGLEIKDFITDVEVVDRFTVKFHFSRVYPYQLMDANDGHIIPKHAWGKVPLDAWESTDFEPILVTAGPFRVASHSRGQTLVLERDPDWWGSPRPNLDRLVLRIIPDVSSQLSQLLSGDLHLLELVPPRDAGRVRAHPDLELIAQPGLLWGFIGWNNRDPLFSDRRVRRAMTLAINRASLVDTAYHGFAKVANGPILSSMWACNKNIQPLPFDPEQARRLLAEAGWRDSDGDGILDRAGSAFEFDLLYPSSNPIRHDIAVLAQADLARVGVACRPTQVEFTSLLARQESGDFQATVTAWSEATKVDLTSAWTTPSDTQGSNNFMAYSNPEVDRLIAAAREESDHTRAKIIFDRIQEIIVEDQPVTFLYEAQQLTAISRRIGGADINPLSVFFNVQDWYLVP